MGVLSGRDQLTSKFITAEITDSKDRVFYIPIKHSMGDYFLADLDGELYAFTLKNARVLTHYKTLTKSFRVIQYDTSHYSSIKPETKELELALRANALPPMDRMMHKIFRILGRQEGKGFKKHDIAKLVEIFADKEREFPEEVKKVKGYLNELAVKEIVTPVRKITDFIQGDLIATSPSYLGSLLPAYHRVNGELRNITNSPIKGTNSMMKIIVVILFVVMIAAVGYIAYDQGVFEGATQMFDSFSTIGDGLSGLPAPGQFVKPASTSGGVDYSDAAIQAKYTPEQLKIAVESGEVDYDKLSSFMQGLVDDVELPKVVETVP